MSSTLPCALNPKTLKPCAKGLRNISAFVCMRSPSVQYLVHALPHLGTGCRRKHAFMRTRAETVRHSASPVRKE